MSWVYTSSGRVRDAYAAGLLRQMLEIRSPSYAEEELAVYLAEVMNSLGFAAYVDGVGNVVGSIGRGTGPTIMLLGHMDTVAGDVAVRSAAGRLYGRGAADAKGPLATMISAAASSRDFAGRIVVVGAVEEETPCSRGAMAIRNTHDRPDVCIIGEPSGWSTVVLGYKGKLDLRYQARCAPTHPSSPAAKASELAFECWAAVKEALGEVDHTAFHLPGVTLDSISGDTATAVADLSIRTPPGFCVATLLDNVRRRLPAGDLTVVNSVTACRADRRNPAVRALSAGIRRQMAQPSVAVKTATSDMNTLAEVWDVPMATYGPGDSKLDHADDEHIVLADYFRAIAVLSHALSELATQPATAHATAPPIPVQPTAPPQTTVPQPSGL